MDLSIPVAARHSYFPWVERKPGVVHRKWCSARLEPHVQQGFNPIKLMSRVPGERLNILVPVCLSFFFLNFSKIWCHLHKLHLFRYFLVIRLAIKSSSNSIYHNVVKCLVRVKWSLPLGLCKYLCFVCSYKPFPSPPSKDTQWYSSWTSEKLHDAAFLLSWRWIGCIEVSPFFPPLHQIQTIPILMRFKKQEEENNSKGYFDPQIVCDWCSCHLCTLMATYWPFFFFLSWSWLLQFYHQLLSKRNWMQFLLLG